mmetsp:Transcript_25159/g.82544  ORF Transcript_25159/g.82544 Transcript_25159/m.82544 type:complete len:148 (+) Transcript_25159:61-504(+)
MSKTKASVVVLVDGDCALCSGFAQFVSARDGKGAVYFETQQSDDGQKLLKHFKMPMDLTTIVTVEAKAGQKPQAFTKSTAVLRTMLFLDWPWPLLAIFMIIPALIRDFCYGRVAAIRYKLFGVNNACQLPPKVLRKRMARQLPPIEL